MSGQQKDQRLIIEMGQGIDLHGMDATKAAGRAIDDALHHSYLGIVGALGLDPQDVRVQVTLGAQDPDRIDTSALRDKFPIGQVTFNCVTGGMNVVDATADVTHVTVMAAIEVFLPAQEGWVLRQSSGAAPE